MKNTIKALLVVAMLSGVAYGSNLSKATLIIRKNSDVYSPLEKKYKLNMEAVINAVIYVESDFDATLIGHERNVGDYSIGYMQLRRDTAKWVGGYKNLTESQIGERLLVPRINIKLGIRYLVYQIERYHGDMRKAIPAYNAGRYRTHDGKCVNYIYYKRWLKAYNRYNKI